MNLALRAFDRLLDALAALAVVALIVVLGVVTADVATRALGMKGFDGGVLISQYALYLIAFCGAPKLLRVGGHIRIDLVVGNLPPWQARFASLVGDAICLVVSLALAYYGVTVTLQSYRAGTMIYETLVFPEWITFWPIPLASACLAIEFLLRIAGLRERQTDAAPTL